MPGIHHVFARGNEKRAIFRTDADREDYLLILGKVVERMHWRCMAYCLMHNHVHLLLEITEANLAAGVQRLHSLYATSFNERYGRTGHVFEGRYGSVLQTSDEQLWHTMAYIVRNPVTAELCAGPEDWPWSSHCAVLGRTAPGWLDVEGVLRSFGGIGGDARRRYAELVG